ncbi:MAG: helix-turn-helix domain-containing protein [Cardiobacteriaceae bacterium]|nr:helix-turn-helix domain-containing protein [Cardiobacteriaceae bacterium]
MIERFPQFSTKDRIIQAAEKLYIEHGITATSLRHITQEANVNLAAVNYYFGSKDGLTRAIFLHRCIPYVRSSAQALRALPSSATVPDIVNALLLPLEELSTLPGHRGIQILNLLIRIGNEAPQNHQYIREATEEMLHTLLLLLHANLPEMDDHILRRRLFILFKAILYTFNGIDAFNMYGNKPHVLLNMRYFIAELRVLIEAGLTAPPPEIEKHF